MQIEDCIFCKIAKGTAPSFKIWEDDNFLAFLSIFPNTKGFTVVIPKEHYTSYIFDLPDDVLANLIFAAKKVGKLLDQKLEDVGRTAMVCEGYGVDHAHVKLVPLHGTKSDKWREIRSQKKDYYEYYQGYVCSNDSQRADSNMLEKLAEKIKN